MTLIAGTLHWNGICLNSDTRVTDSFTGEYKDNACKIAHIHGGFGMIASGNRQLAIIIRETLRKRLDEFAETNIKFGYSTDLTGTTEYLLKSGLTKVKDHPEYNPRPINETKSSGLIGVSLPDQKLRLSRDECSNLLSIILNGSQGMNLDFDFYKKYMMKIVSCYKGEIPFLEMDYPHSLLYKYSVEIAFDPEKDLFNIERIPFGQIVALGSGSLFDYSLLRDRVLFFVLFNGSFMDTELGSLHLSMIHEYAESEVPPDSRFNIKTFGGAIVPGIVASDPNGNSKTGIVECDLGSKPEGRVVSKVFEKNDQLWVETRAGEQVPLEKFPLSTQDDNQMLWK